MTSREERRTSLGKLDKEYGVEDNEYATQQSTITACIVV